MTNPLKAFLGMIAVSGGLVTAFYFVGENAIYHERKNPQLPKIEYINQDSLPDLKYPNGNWYLQTKEGNFVSYETVMQQKRAKLDSRYQVKQDSLKKIYENKLEEIIRDE